VLVIGIVVYYGFSLSDEVIDVRVQGGVIGLTVVGAH